MATKPTRPSARTRQTAASTPAGTAPAPSKKPLPWLWIGLAVVIIAAAVIAVVSSGDDEGLSVGSVPENSTVVSGAPGESKGEVWPITVTGTALDPWVSEDDDPTIGTTAPGLSGFTFDGSAVNVDPSAGPVMLVYLAHWCPHCNRELPKLLEWKAGGGVPDGLQVIGVTTAVNPDRDNYPPSEWIVNMGWDWPVLADSENNDAAVAMGVSSFPFVIIIGTDGTVLTRWAGEVGVDGIQERVDAALA
jgi:cytochrome c biogenesis protein CcmG/thiol:disulfide interchange protein DsbE